jgi:hypothetical protein
VVELFIVDQGTWDLLEHVGVVAAIALIAYADRRRRRP